jgi:serine/threonine protein kinase/Tol biopolymer transport system component
MLTSRREEPLLIGNVISHYEILERLGGGGMGVVYKARDVRLGRLVALKFLSPRLSASPAHKQRLLREARAASALDHPAVCTVYEVDETADGQLFIAMAFCQGETLKSRIERGPLPPERAVALVLQIADGLAAAHEKGVVHRDVKPANVLLLPGGGVKLVDFGVAQLEDGTRLTRPGTAMGTASYMSPEQLRGELVDQRSDLWSLGVVLYETVTGRLPFPGLTDQEVVTATLTRDPERLPAAVAAALPGLESALARALARRPQDRYQNIEQMAAALRSLRPAVEDPTLLEPTQVELTPWPFPAGPLPTGPLPAGRLPTLPPGFSGPSPVSPPEPTGSMGSGGTDDERPTRSAPAGRAIAHFQVGAPIGGGGMGIVYRAEDTRLGRTVALKFLPPALSLDPEAKVRFLQEARSASALEHPNICTIHEVGETPDGRLYLAMPCYDGETLRQKIVRGPLPVAEAVDIAEQVARGLAKAHRLGIVHRDIKPANLMVTDDGVVKILDFGVAKLAGPAMLAGSLVEASAGTPAYMSPEQAGGEEVDARTDLWSLGVVLYEMLAGRRPYRGEHQQAMVYALTHETPEPLAAQRPEVPDELARIVARLLATDRRERYPDAAAVVADLRGLRGDTTTETVSRAVVPPPPAGRWSPRRRWIAAAAGLLLVAAAGATLWLSRGPRGRPPVQVQASLLQLTDLEGSETFPSLSPDASSFVYTRSDGGDLDLFARSVDGGEAVNLTADAPADDTQPAFSPDGRAIAFRSERDGGGLYVMRSDGSGVRRLADFGYNPAWSPDGRFVLCATEGVIDPGIRRSNSELWRIEVATGARRPVLSGDGVDAVQPNWSPDGRRIAYWGLPPGSSRRVVWTAAVDGSDRRVMVDDEYLSWNPVFSPDGRFLYFASNRSGSMNLWRLPLDKAGAAAGEPQPVTLSATPYALMSFSRDGRRILFAVDARRANLERVGLDPAAGRVLGTPVPVTQGARLVRSVDVSPDGRRIAFQGVGPREDLWLVGADGAGLRQLTDDPAKDRNPRWSPDGRQIVFYSDRSGKYEAWSVHPGDGRLEQLSQTAEGALTVPVWGPDGRRLVCTLGSRAAVFLDLARPLAGRQAGRLPPAGPGGEVFLASSWSADGTQLAGTIQRPDERPLPGLVTYDLATGRYTRHTDSGADPHWLAGGRLLYIDDGAVRMLDPATGRVHELLSPPPFSAYTTAAADPRGTSLFAVRATDEGDIWLITLQ